MKKKSPERDGSGREWNQELLSGNILPFRPRPHQARRQCAGCGFRFLPVHPRHALCRQCFGYHRAGQALNSFRRWLP